VSATRVVNVRTEPSDVRIDRPSRWGNPYRIGQPWSDLIADRMTRADVIQRYRGWLQGQLIIDPAFLEPLRGKVLGCWCKPLPCHGDVIVELLEARA
jgi:hypothetical protein